MLAPSYIALISALSVAAVVGLLVVFKRAQKPSQETHEETNEDGSVAGADNSQTGGQPAPSDSFEMQQPGSQPPASDSFGNGQPRAAVYDDANTGADADADADAHRSDSGRTSPTLTGSGQ